MGKSGGPTPDYSGAVDKQAQAGWDSMLYQTNANRPDIYTPWGQLTWGRPDSTAPAWYNNTGGQSTSGGTAPVPTAGELGAQVNQTTNPTPPSYLPPELDTRNRLPIDIFAPGEPENTGTDPLYIPPGSDTSGASQYGTTSLIGSPAGTGDRYPSSGSVDPRYAPSQDYQPPPPGGTAGSAPYTSPDAAASGAAQGGSDDWKMFLTLNPQQQAALDAQMRLGAQRSGLGELLFNRAYGELGSPMNWDSLPQVSNGMDARQRAEDAIYSRSTSRLDPMWAQREQQLRNELAGQGLDPTHAAYQQALADFNRSRTDAYQSALDSSIAGGGNEMTRQYGIDSNARQNAIAEAMQRRGWTLNEINGLLSGQQVGMPQMPGFNAAGLAQGPNYFGAAQAAGQFGLDSAASQNQMFGDIFGGLGSLGGGMFSFFRPK